MGLSDKELKERGLLAALYNLICFFTFIGLVTIGGIEFLPALAGMVILRLFLAI